MLWATIQIACMSQVNRTHESKGHSEVIAALEGTVVEACNLVLHNTHLVKER